jgi:competence protein ComEC
VELHRTPLLRLVIPFIIGILFNYYFAIPFPAILVGLSITLAALFYFILLKSKQSQLSLSGRVGVVVYCSLFFAGSFASYHSNALNNPNHVTYKNNYQKLWIRVISTPEEKEKTYKVTAHVEFVIKNDTLHNTTGKILLYLSKTAFDSTIKYGDYLLIKNKLQAPPTALGKDSFNYAKWLSHKNIYHTAFLRSNDYIKTEKNKANPLFTFSYTTRSYFDSVLHTYLPNKDTYSIASAIILGIRNHIDEEYTNAYARSGTIHILAVSGLHVGAIYLVLSFLLSRLKKRKRVLLVKAISLLCSLWFYALLTGLSPSVVRATTMFSFIAIGEVLGRKTNVFNSLAAAALFTLAIDANAIFHVGFQLSYLAVAGIGLFYRPLFLLLTPKTWLLTKVWQLVSVSTAAQIATFPLAVYYFHQFPNYFLLANVLIVPLAMLAVYAGLTLLLVSAIPSLAVYIGKALHLILFTNNYLAKAIEGLPYAYTSNIYISWVEVVALYGAIIFLYQYIKTKKAAYLMGFLCSLILIILL